MHLQGLTWVLKMSKAFSALQQFAVLIKVSFAAITKRPNNMRGIKNKIISLSCTRPHASSLCSCRAALLHLWAPVPAKSLPWYTQHIVTVSWLKLGCYDIQVPASGNKKV